MNDSTVLTFRENDQLSLQTFSKKLERFLTIEHEFVDDSLVIALKAPFGSGKTWFLSMWKNDLERRRRSTSSLPIPIMLNAWEDDYCGDPLLSIITGIMNGLPANESKGEKQSLREAAKDVAWFMTGLANEVASKIAGFDPIAAGKFAKEKQEDRELPTPDFVELFEEKKKAVNTLKTELNRVFGGESLKAIVFVDELDRCRPDYAINYLETIKHVFGVHGLIFVLAVDYDQLACSAKTLLGQEAESTITMNSSRPKYRRADLMTSSKVIPMPEMLFPRHSQRGFSE